MTQFLEGHWGNSPVAIGAMKLRIVHYRKRQRQLIKQYHQRQDVLREQLGRLAASDSKHQDTAREGGDPDEWNREARERNKENSLLRSKRGDQLIVHVVSIEAAEKRPQRYPKEINRVMPTRLGNALRRFEDAAGSQYRLDAILTAPHFSLIAPDEHTQYLRESRQ